MKYYLFLSMLMISCGSGGGNSGSTTTETTEAAPEEIEETAEANLPKPTSWIPEPESEPEPKPKYKSGLYTWHLTDYTLYCPESDIFKRLDDLSITWKVIIDEELGSIRIGVAGTENSITVTGYRGTLNRVEWSDIDKEFTARQTGSGFDRDLGFMSMEYKMTGIIGENGKWFGDYEMDLTSSETSGVCNYKGYFKGEWEKAQ
jgi:hypothetical protein